MNVMQQSEQTRKLLIRHYRSYPDLKIQDVFKFLYQSAFGCEHLVSSLEVAKEYVSKELAALHNEGERGIDLLDGAYSRVPLSYMDHGLSAETFAKLFVASAKQETNGMGDLLQKLKIAKELVAQGSLPFRPDEFENAAAEWAAEGYPAIHHSNAFREAYRPSYRVIANEYVPYLPLFAELDRRLARGSVTVAIEGGSASGKTALGNILSTLYDCTVFHTDDFFLRPEQRTAERYAEVGGNIDRERFLEEVLQPLGKGETVNYRKFDCATMRIGEETKIEPKKLTVIEGVYSMHPEFEKYYDLSVFLDISPELQRERIRKRNSSEMASRFFHEWIPLETVYFDKTEAKARCDLKIQIGSIKG